LVTIQSPNSCAILKATSFGIFMNHWPWTIGLFMIGLGAHTLFFGFKHFRLSIIFTFMSVFFFTTMVILSNVGFLRFLEESHLKMNLAHSLLFIIISLLAVGAGAIVGKYIDERYGLMTIVGIDVFIVSTAAYMFLMSFTGLWEMIIVVGAAMSGSCGYISMRPTFEN